MKHDPDPDFDAWKAEALQTDIVQAFGRTLAGRGHKLTRVGREHFGPCPVCGGTDTFAINTAKQVFLCRKGGAKGNAISMVMHVDGVEYLDAIETITGRPRPGRDRREETEAERAAREDRLRRQQLDAKRRQENADREAAAAAIRKQSMAREVWLSSSPVAGTLAESYLAGRGLAVDRVLAEPNLRFNSSVLHPGGSWHPALVVRVTDEHDVARSIWRIFLGDGPKGRAPVSPSKMALGPAHGCAARIGGEAETIGVCEGVETALAIRELNEWEFPVWSLLSTSGFHNWIPPQSIRRVFIYADIDRARERKDGSIVQAPGRRAAEVLSARLQELGIARAIVDTPNGGKKDWVDILRQTKGLPPE